MKPAGRRRFSIALATGLAVALLSAVSAAPTLASPRIARPPAKGYGAGPNYCREWGNSNSKFSFEGVYACNSTRSNGATDFDSAGNVSFQCVELSVRFLWAIYGIWAGPGTGVGPGAGLVSVVHQHHPSIPIGTPGPGSVPAPGDVISLGPGPAGVIDPEVGHTAVVVGSTPSTGVFNIISQNDPEGSAGEQTLKVDLSGHHPGKVDVLVWSPAKHAAVESSATWTPAKWLVLKQPSNPAPSPAPAPTPAPTPTPTPKPCAAPVKSAGYSTPCEYTVGTYKVVGTAGNGLYQHTGPGTGYPDVTNPHTLAENSTLHIACQAITASKVNGSGVWDLLTDGDWVSDYYTNTPVVGNYSPGLAHCVTG